MLLCTVGVISDENIKVKDPEGLAAEARQQKKTLENQSLFIKHYYAFVTLAAWSPRFP
jgi:hypothetical protein